MSFILLGILNSQVSGAAGGSYELIESNILTSSASSVTFSSIPADYKHLQIRLTVRGSYGFEGFTIGFRVNGDSGSNYAVHRLYGTGTGVSSQGYSSQTGMFTYRMPGSTATSGSYGGAVVDFLDYANTSKNTTMRYLGGFNSSGERNITLASGLWMNTNAVTSLNVYDANGSGFVSGSRFSLYGIRG